VQLALSGHPALIVPRSWASPQFGRRALIAWNGSAQSAAAVRKALPLLRRAEQVSLLIGHSRASFPATMRPPELDIIAYLKHEGVAVDVNDLPVSDADAGAAILKLAKKEKIDLIVMGAFGRSRFKEWILGGATRHVLENMTVPVFMAHQ
jgi:nucleotide-binding universal stress UspA family protein